MGLPWVRIDSHMASHDKVLALISSDAASQATKWQALTSHIFAIGWSASHETDGRIPSAALPFVHGTSKTAGLLVAFRFWEPVAGGWQIRHFDEYQQTSDVTEVISAERSAAGRKGACKLHHGPDCWKNGRCSRA